MSEEYDTFKEYAMIGELSEEITHYRQHLLTKGIIRLPDVSTAEHKQYRDTYVTPGEHVGFIKSDIEGLFRQIATKESGMQQHMRHSGNHDAPCSCMECALALGQIMDLETILRNLAKLEPSWNIKVERAE